MTKKEKLLRIKKALEGDKDFEILFEVIDEKIKNGEWKWGGKWSTTKTYLPNDLVYHEGSAFICIKKSSGKAPGESGEWDIVVSRGQKGDPGPASKVPGPEGKASEIPGPPGLPGPPGPPSKIPGPPGSASKVPGPPGKDGNTWHNGAGAPDDSIGKDGDFYLDTLNDAYWGPKTTGTWKGTGPHSLIGPPGAKGIGVSGPPGPQGNEGMDWRGAWDPTTEYLIDDVVEHNGSSYIAVAINTGSEPPSVDWNLVAQKGGGAPGGIIGDGIAKITVGTNEPVAPEVGDLWVDTN
jgi:hypothetical protein